MLKPYKELSRWYGALEPDASQADPAARDRVRATPSGPTEAGDSPDALAGPRAVPDPEPEPDREPESREPDPEEARARAEVPTDLPARRSEFVGGWSDWVAGDHAPGPDDDYEPRPSGPVRFPWPEDERDDEPVELPHARSNPALRTAAREHPAARRARLLLVVVVSLVLLVAAVLGALWLLNGTGGDTPPPRSMQFTAGSTRTDAAADCPIERGVGVLRGAEAGGTQSGPDAVLAFQYAYYVERSGERARAVVAPEAPISPAPVIQRGIDTVPAGTTHCVRVVTITENRYSVEVTEYRPGGTPATYNRQTVTTAVIGGRTLITGIAAG
ncbi:hypothetical protein ACWEKT_25755 [Nocardia takedensis]